MDLKLPDAEPTTDERDAVDALLGAPSSAWDGGPRGNPVDAHVAIGGHEARARRHLLLPALQAVQSRVGWISEGALGYVCERLDVPPADAWGVATFYALLATTPRPRRVLHLCDDIACRCRGAEEIATELERTAGAATSHAPDGSHVMIGDDETIWMRSPCLGLCDHAPAALLTIAGDQPVERLIGDVTASRAKAIIDGAEPGVETADLPAIPQRGEGDESLRLLRRIGVVDPTSIDAYEASGGWRGLRRAIEIGAPAVVREVMDSKLMGRGGAAFPTGRKWEAVAAQPARPHFLVCNADESEPGTFKDRVLMVGDPFAVVESMVIAGFATGCERGYLYVRGEYPLALRRMQYAIDRARERGFLGANILGSGYSLEIEIRRGAGAYICGEETAIFNSIEGFRGEPRNKPPFPVQAGLFGRPTVVNNVETLVNVPYIVSEGGAAFARVGTEQSTGTKLFCVSGNVARPGTYEVPFGVTLGQLLEMANGGPKRWGNGRRVQAVLLGGAAGVFVRPDEVDIPLSLEGVRAAGATLGSGVVMVFDESVNLRDTLLRIAAFFRDESCGQCVPCRVGTVRQEEALVRIISGMTHGGVASEVALLDEVGVAMRDASICGLGQTAYAAVESAIKRLGMFSKGNGGSTV